MCSTGKS